MPSGLTAYFLWTGRRPYERQALGALLDDQLHAPIPSACAQRPELPPAADEVLGRLCAKAPADRPATMAAAARLLATLRPKDQHLASFTTRAFALFLDLVIVSAVAAALGKAYLVLQGFVSLPDPSDLVVEWISAALALGSQVGMEARYGGSLGKLLFHLRVVRADGGRLSWPALFQRFFLRFPAVAFVVVPDPWPPYGEMAANGVQLLALAAGAGCYLLGRGQSLSDRLTKTRVVLRPVPSPETGARIP